MFCYAYQEHFIWTNGISLKCRCFCQIWHFVSIHCVGISMTRHICVISNINKSQRDNVDQYSMNQEMEILMFLSDLKYLNSLSVSLSTSCAVESWYWYGWEWNSYKCVNFIDFVCHCQRQQAVTYNTSIGLLTKNRWLIWEGDDVPTNAKSTVFSGSDDSAQQFQVLLLWHIHT